MKFWAPFYDKGRFLYNKISKHFNKLTFHIYVRSPSLEDHEYCDSVATLFKSSKIEIEDSI